MIDGLKSTVTSPFGNGGVVVGAVVNGSGHLIITLSNGQTIDAGVAKGLDGIAGATGAKGDKGDRGETGATGQIGATGAKGDKGDKGDRGQSLEIDRIGPLANKSFYDNEVTNFMYLAIDTSKIYLKLSDAAGDWSDPIDFVKGVKGDIGAKGDSFTINEVLADTDMVSTTANNQVIYSAPKNTVAVNKTKTYTVFHNGKLWFKTTDAGKPSEWYGPVQFTGAKGDPGQGIAVDYKGPKSSLTQFDNVKQGFTFLDIENNVLFIKQSDNHKDWREFKYFEGAKGSKGDKGDKGDQGDRGTGLAVNMFISVPFASVESTSEIVNLPVGSVVFSTSESMKTVVEGVTQVFRGLGRAKTAAPNVWSNPFPIQGAQGADGKDGNGLAVDATGLESELDTFSSLKTAKQGFTFLAVDTQRIFIKKADFPYPGQDLSVDFSLPENNTSEYLNKKRIWDSSSTSERRDILWSIGSLSLGPQGQVGPRGPQGEQGLQGKQGEQGLRGFSLNPDYRGPGLTSRALYDNTPDGTSFLDTTHGLIYYRQTSTYGVWGPGIPLSGLGSGGGIANLKYTQHDTVNNVHNVLSVYRPNAATGIDTLEELYIPGSAYSKLEAKDFALNPISGLPEAIVPLGVVFKNQPIDLEVHINTIFSSPVTGENIKLTYEFMNPSNPDQVLRFADGSYCVLEFAPGIANNEYKGDLYASFVETGKYSTWSGILDLIEVSGKVQCRLRATILGTTILPTSGRANVLLRRS